MRHQTIQVGKGENRYGICCGKPHRLSLVPDPLALLIDANGRVETPKSRFIRGLSRRHGKCEWERKAKGSPREKFDIHAYRPANLVAGGRNTLGRRIDYVAVSGDWRDDSEKPTTLLAIQLGGELIDHVPVRASMLWPHFSAGAALHVSCIPGLLSLAHCGFGGRHVQNCAQHVAMVLRAVPKQKKPWTS